MPLPHRNSEESSGLLKILGAVFSGVLLGLFLSKLKALVHDPDTTEKTQQNPSEQSANHENLASVPSGPQVLPMKTPQA